MNIELTEKEQKELLKSAMKEVMIEKIRGYILYGNNPVDTIINKHVSKVVKELIVEPEFQDRIKKAVKESIDSTLTAIAEDPFDFADHDIVQPLMKQLVDSIKNTEIVFKQKES